MDATVSQITRELIDQRLHDLNNPELIHPIDELYSFLNAD